MFTVLFSIFLITFTFYVLKIGGFLKLSYFGLEGMFDMLLSLPLALIALAIMFMAGSLILVRRYEAVYSRPLVYSAGVLFLVFI